MPSKVEIGLRAWTGPMLSLSPHYWILGALLGIILTLIMRAISV